MNTSTKSPLAQFAFVMRHGERLDDLFRNDPITWKMHCERQSVYSQWDPKMPTTLDPFADRPLAHFADDPLLSAVGEKMAEAVGTCLLRDGLLPDAIYTSPALRCVQTAEFLSRACFSDGEGRPKIRVEVGLYGTSFSHLEEPRDWVEVEAFTTAGYHVDREYKSLMSQAQLWETRNDAGAYQDRVYRMFDHIFGKEKVLIVGHASTPDLAAAYFHSRSSNSQKINAKSFAELGAGVPYCGNILFERRPGSNGQGQELQLNVTFNAAAIEIGSFVNRILRN